MARSCVKEVFLSPRDVLRDSKVGSTKIAFTPAIHQQGTLLFSVGVEAQRDVAPARFFTCKDTRIGYNGGVVHVSMIVQVISAQPLPLLSPRSVHVHEILAEPSLSRHSFDTASTPRTKFVDGLFRHSELAKNRQARRSFDAVSVNQQG